MGRGVAHGTNAPGGAAVCYPHPAVHNWDDFAPPLMFYGKTSVGGVFLCSKTAQLPPCRNRQASDRNIFQLVNEVVEMEGITEAVKPGNPIK